MWEAVRAQSSGAEAHVVCSPRPEEAEFLTKNGLAFTALPVRNPTPLRPISFLRSLALAWRVVSVFRPDIVFSKGGAVSIPVAFVAWLRGIPVVLHESDAVSGRANRLVALWAKKICHGFPRNNDELRMTNDEYSRFAIRDSQSIFTGNPVRAFIASGTKEVGRRITGLVAERPVLLVIGGSQGATALNEAVLASLGELLHDVQIVHLTGPGKKSPMKKDGYWSAPFVHEELPHLYALADFALSRAGAGAIAELAACGVPMILVPLRGVAHDHQQVNASVAAATGGCICLDQERLAREMAPLVRTLARDETKRREMAGHVRRLSSREAAQTIASILFGVINP